jgi:hypothetical protein
MNDDQIKHMVGRFLQWRLPANFDPDAGISFKRTFNEPTGTNLFDATQAEEMVRYMVEGMAEASGRTTPPLLDRFIDKCHELYGICGHCGKRKCPARQEHSKLPQWCVDAIDLLKVVEAAAPDSTGPQEKK